MRAARVDGNRGNAMTNTQYNTLRTALNTAIAGVPVSINRGPGSGQNFRVIQRGGTLVYATCSSEPEENDDVTTAFLRAHADFTLERRHQTLPFEDGLEAFFGAVLRRAV